MLCCTTFCDTTLPYHYHSSSFLPVFIVYVWRDIVYTYACIHTYLCAWRLEKMNLNVGRDVIIMKFIYRCGLIIKLTIQFWVSSGVDIFSAARYNFNSKYKIEYIRIIYYLNITSFMCIRKASVCVCAYIVDD